MSKTYRPYEPDQLFFLPPSLTERLPKNRQVFSIREVLDENGPHISAVLLSRTHDEPLLPQTERRPAIERPIPTAGIPESEYRRAKWISISAYRSIDQVSIPFNTAFPIGIAPLPFDGK